MTAQCGFEAQNRGLPTSPAIQPGILGKDGSLSAKFPSWLRPFLSVAAWQYFNQGHPGDSAQPFEATVFFGDMVDSSVLLTQYPLSTFVCLLNRFFTLIEDIIHEHSGFTEKLLGDGVLAIFRNAQAAVRAAHVIQQALADFDTAKGERPLLARIALDSGPVIVTSLGGPWRMDHTVIGVPVNAASHLLQFVRPGEIWFTQATRERLGDTNLLTETNLIELKGYTTPQTIYRLGGGYGGGKYFRWRDDGD